MRLFIGMAVPEEVRIRVLKTWEALEDRPNGIRSIPPENWHFTLAFLGDVAEENIQALEVLIEKSLERPPNGSFSFTEFQTFPRTHASYVVARAVPEHIHEWNSFITLLRDMASVVAPKLDRKPWVPHLSIARTLRHGRRLPVWRQEIVPFTWTPRDITLIKSEPNPGGSRYIPLRVFSLKTPAR